MTGRPFKIYHPLYDPFTMLVKGCESYQWNEVLVEKDAHFLNVGWHIILMWAKMLHFSYCLLIYRAGNCYPRVFASFSPIRRIAAWSGCFASMHNLAIRICNAKMLVFIIMRWFFLQCVVILIHIAVHITGLTDCRHDWPAVAFNHFTPCWQAYCCFDGSYIPSVVCLGDPDCPSCG